MNDLLPSNSTPLLRALAALSDRINGIDPDSISHLWDANKCPDIVLPWLAWSMSVDAWDDTWSVERQRQAIAQSPEYHRLKGTVSSLDIVSRLFGCRTSITEWWQKQPSGRRGTATIRAFITEQSIVGAPMITTELVNKVRAAVYITKPKSRAITLEMGVAIDGRLTMATAGQAMHVAELAATATTSRHGRMSPVMAAAGQVLHVSIGGSTLSPPNSGRSSSFFAAAAQALQVGYFQAFARHRSMR